MRRVYLVTYFATGMQTGCVVKSLPTTKGKGSVEFNIAFSRIAAFFLSARSENRFILDNGYCESFNLVVNGNQNNQPKEGAAISNYCTAGDKTCTTGSAHIQ
jgi:hypothetical protein